MCCRQPCSNKFSALCECGPAGSIAKRAQYGVRHPTRKCQVFAAIFSPPGVLPWRPLSTKDRHQFCNRLYQKNEEGKHNKHVSTLGKC